MNCDDITNYGRRCKGKACIHELEYAGPMPDKPGCIQLPKSTRNFCHVHGEKRKRMNVGDQCFVYQHWTIKRTKP